MSKRDKAGQAAQGSSMEMMPTGIARLDAITGGGIPKGAFIMLVGEPGSGKTVLAQQLCFNWAKRQENNQDKRKAIYFSTLSETHEKLITHINKFGFYNDAVIPDLVELLSLQDPLAQGIERTAEVVVNTARQRKAGLVIIDGLRSLVALVGGGAKTALLLSQLSAQLSFLGCTMIVTVEADYDQGISGELLTTSDGIIALYHHRVGVHTVKYIEVPKMRGVAQLEGLHSYEITNEGWQVYPRLEALVTRAGQPDTPVEPNKRLAIGAPEIDKLMRGGVPKGSMTMLAGSPSTGKTLLSLHYLNTGAQQGQPGLMLNFGETRQQLIDRATRFHLPLAQGIADGLIRLHNITPVEIEPNKIAQLICDEIEEHKIERLVIDGIDEIERTTHQEQRSADYIAALVSYLRQRGVTALFNKSVPKITGAEFDLGDSAMSLVAENLLLMRYSEQERRLYRSILVLKMRDSEYDQTIREFAITDAGIKVLPLAKAK